MISRRESVKVFASGAAVGLTGAVIVSTTSCAPTEAPAAERSIASMFEEWFAIHHRDNRGETEDESEAIFVGYTDLLNRIIRAKPSTPRDVAMQFYADTGNHESEISDEFGKRLLAMALEGRAA